ncbi:MAG: BMP family ABC transporter substrate-binding protein, partial [Hyphomicrobiaceae bacterium]
MTTLQKCALTICVAVLAAAGISAANVSAAGKTKVGFVYVGPIGDHGWSYQHHAGLKAVEQAFGDKVETTFVEKVSEG